MTQLKCTRMLPKYIYGIHIQECFKFICGIKNEQHNTTSNMRKGLLKSERVGKINFKIYKEKENTILGLEVQLLMCFS